MTKGIMGSNKRIFVNTGVLYLRVVLTLVISLLSTRYILQALGETDFGLYNLIAGVVTLLSFLSTSMSSSTQRYMSYEKGRSKDVQSMREVYSCSMGMHIWTAVVLFIIVSVGGGFLIAYGLNIPTEKVGAAYIVLFTVSISLAGAVMHAPYDAVLMARENIVFFAICQFGSALLRLIMAIGVMFLPGNHLIQYAVATALIPFATLFAERWYCKAHYEEVNECRIKLDLRKSPLVKQMGSFMSLTLFGSMGWTVRTQGYAIILNLFWGVVINAANGIATQVSNAITTFSTSLTTSMRPQLIQAIAAKDEVRSLQLIDWSCKFPILLVSLLSIPVFIMLPYIMEIWLTVVPPHTVFFCRCLLIAMILNQATLGLAICLDAKGCIKQLHLWVGGSLIACTLLAYFCCRMGRSANFMYYLLIANNLFICVTRVILAARYGGIFISRFLLKTILPPVIVGIITFPIIYVLWKLLPANILTFISTGAAAVIIYSLLAAYIVFNAQSRREVVAKVTSLIANQRK